MCLNIDHVVIQTDHFRLAEDEVEVLQCFAEPEALHFIAFRGSGVGNIFERSVGDLGLGCILNALEHLPSCILQRGVAYMRYSINRLSMASGRSM